MLHLEENPLLTEPLSAEHVKPRPSGHWGTVPGTAWALAHVALAAGELAPAREVVPVLGAGHAGVVQLAFSWLTGRLAHLRPQYSRDVAGLRQLARDFPDTDGLGSEVHPQLIAGAAPGGCLGGALAFSHGLALDAGIVTVPIIGDGECETPTTAASWLAARALDNSAVVPVVHVNGFRMGARSVLGALTDSQLVQYAAGLGWHGTVVRVTAGSALEHRDFRTALLQALEQAPDGSRTAVFLRCVKGWSGPARIGQRQVAGTAGAHKTPLTEARTDAQQRELLERWLASYRPGEIFDGDGQPVGALADALATGRFASGFRKATPPVARPGRCSPGGPARFAEMVGSVLRQQAMSGSSAPTSWRPIVSVRLRVSPGCMRCSPRRCCSGG